MHELEQKKLPNATVVLILGILSILSCCCYGIIGIIIGGIALMLYKKDKKIYDQNPSLYVNYANLNTGRILAVIGLVFNILFILYLIWAISFFGWEALQNQELLQEKLNELQ